MYMYIYMVPSVILALLITSENNIYLSTLTVRSI